MSLKNFSKADLEEELKRRENLGDTPPQQIENPDLSALKIILADYIDNIFNDDHNPDSDDTEYIFEEAMRTFYGQDIFKWIRNNT